MDPVVVNIAMVPNNVLESGSLFTATSPGEVFNKVAAHVHLVLCELPSILERRHLSRDYMQTFHYKRALWYSPDFSVEQYVLQYAQQVVIPECDEHSSTAYRVFPPVIKPRKGRRKGRFTKKQKTSSTTTPTNKSRTSSSNNQQQQVATDDEDEDGSGESDSSSGSSGSENEHDTGTALILDARHNTSAYVMPPLLGTQESATPVKSRSLIHCGLCGSPEHNRRNCNRKDISYIYQLHELHKVLDTAEVLPDELRHQLSSAVVISRAATPPSSNSSVPAAASGVASIDFQTQVLPAAEEDMPVNNAQSDDEDSAAQQYAEEEDNYDSKHFRCLPCVLAVPTISMVAHLPQACPDCAPDKNGFNVLVLPAPRHVEDRLIELGIWSGSNQDKYRYDENIVTYKECFNGEGYSELYGMSLNGDEQEDVPYCYDDYAKKVGLWWYWRGGDMV